jgi:hypothetical protein
MKKATAKRMSDADALRAILDARDGMIHLLRQGYGDPHNRLKIEQMRESLQYYRTEYPEVWEHAEQIQKRQRS